VGSQRPAHCERDMKTRSWPAECALHRINHGKKPCAEIENERDGQRLKALVAKLVTRWATEDAADQRVKTESANEIMNENDTVPLTQVTGKRPQLANTADDSARKLRYLVHTELKKRFLDHTHYNEVLADVVKKHPQLAGAKAELANEFNALPSPVQFRAEVRREQTAQNCSYELAFETVADRYPALRQPQFGNEDLGDSAAAGNAFRELVNRYFVDHPTLKRTSQHDYDFVFAKMSREHPELTARMHTPMRSNANVWLASTSDGKTPTRKSAPQGQGKNLPAATPPERAAKLAV
jgi:hypothetical protein